MRQSHIRQAPFAIALGGACLLGIGIAGCSRDAGLDLAKSEAKTDSIISERANDSIVRSKQELASADGKSAGKSPGKVSQASAELDEKPSLASRWKAPFKSVGNLLKRKPDDEGEITDPFLARREENAKAEERQVAANASKAAAAERAKAASPDTRSATGAAGEKKMALADTAGKSGAAATPAKTAVAANAAKPKSTLSSESQAALDDFLKSQGPIGVSDHVLAADSQTISRKPGTGAGAASNKRTADPAASVALDDSAAEGVSRTGVKAGKARPFPGAGAEPEPKAVAAAKKPTADRPAKTTLAAASAGARRNPLVEDAQEEEETTARTKQATGREIAILLKKARAAGIVGEFEEAKSYAIEASELAEQCSYEFAANESSPAKVLGWLEAKEEAAGDTSIRPRTDRYQIAASRKPAREVAATPTGFEKRTAEQIFAEEVDATVAAGQSAGGESSFQEWAAGVGKTPIAKSPSSPNWPVLSQREMTASDDLWQPSRSEFQQQWTDLRTNVAPKDAKKSAETRLASAESDAPAFVATAQGELAAPVIASAARTSDPIVQLGEPTDLAPGVETVRSSSRRGPRLAAPPPLSIEDASEPRVVASSSKGQSRARIIWYAAVAGLSLLVLLAFRKWAYKTRA
jgi:hypothetical protein